MRSTLLFIALLLPCFVTIAGELELRGYGTLSGVHASQAKGIAYVRDIGQPKGVSESDTTLYTDTRFGLQLDYNYSHDLTFTVQALSKYQADSTYTPEVTWAMAKYTLAPGLDLRLGRTKLDFYFQADVVNLGFSALTVRPPIDFYIFPLPPSDGFTLDYTKPFQGGYLTSSINAGWFAPDDLPYHYNEYNLDGSPLFGGSLHYETVDWSVKFSYGQVKPSADLEALADLAQLIRPHSEELADGLIPRNHWIKYFSLGGTWRVNRWQGLAAISAFRTTTQVYPSSNQMFFNLGYRIDKLIPFVAFSSVKTVNDIIEIETGSFLDDMALEAQSVTQTSQKTYSIGARYDMTSNIALKAQYDYMSRDPDLGALVLIAPEKEEPDGVIRLFTLSLDYYF